MPQFSSLLPAAPAAPAAAPATTLAAAPATLVPPDLTSPNFLAQFKSALKNLANAVALPQLSTAKPAAAANGGPLMSALPDEHSEGPVADGASKPVDPNMPALLAELGFAIVPPTFLTPPATVAAPPSQGAVAQAQLTPVLLTGASAAKFGPTLIHDATAPVRPDAAVPVPAVAADQVPSQTPSLPSAPPLLAQLKPSDQLPPQLQPTGQPQPQPPVSSTPPTRQTQPTPTIAAELSAAGVVPLPAPIQPGQTATAPASATTASPLMAVQQVSQNGSQSGAANASKDHGRHAGDKTAPTASETVSVQTAPVSDAALTAALTSAAPVTTAPQLAPSSVSAVVSQIARHADLIRLPGNQGLRIQLHPDDLGGVQVTVRYSPAGGVELHINAEHAATGSLVQAGWSELRDSLATQGISADRLTLSVTGPTGAGQADLSGGGGNRSDSSSYGSGQSSQASLNSQSSQDSQGQSRQDPSPQRKAQSWSAPLDPISSPDGTPRTASAAAAPSRIDYRV